MAEELIKAFELRFFLSTQKFYTHIKFFYSFMLYVLIMTTTPGP